jgi:hypothetical protein
MADDEKVYPYADKAFSDADQEYESTSDKILQLSDKLSEDIVLENIKDQLGGDMPICTDEINYVSLYRTKLDNLDPNDPWYDGKYLRDSISALSLIVGAYLKKKYGVMLGKDIEYCDLKGYLTDLETLYEFLFIRQFDNLVSYFEFEIKKNKKEICEKYCKILQDGPISNDVFVAQAKKKYANEGDVAVIYFMGSIIDDIISSKSSAYDLFTEIASLDSMEEFDARMLDLVSNYGNGVSFTGDSEAYSLYMSPLDDPEVKARLKNELLLDYMKGCELSDEGKQQQL